MSEGIRLNKYLSEAGVCSRRTADDYIEQGFVKLNGKTAITGQRVMEGDTVTFKGKPVKNKDISVILAYHKPTGLTCTAGKG